MDLGIDGRVALVLGASRGIGRGIAAALAREGARCDREPLAGALESAAAEIEGEAVAFEADTADLDRMARAARRGGARRSGRSRSWSPTPAARRSGGALDDPLDEWQRGLPLAGPRAAGADRARRCRACASAAGAGSSTSARARRASRSAPDLSNAHRLAAVGFLKTLAARGRRRRGHGQHGRHRALRHRPPRLQLGLLGGDGARRAADVPAGRLGQPEEYGDLVAFLCSERAAYLTGTSIPLDGGLLRSV